MFAAAGFRAPWGAQLLSVAGISWRVALTVLVHDQTRSALLAAVAYAGCPGQAARSLARACTQ